MEKKTKVISAEAIQQRIGELGTEISRDFKGKKLLVIGILNGAFIFLADLVRQIDLPIQIDFVRVASYGASTTSSKSISFSKDIEIPIQNQEILLVEDIIDTGRTITWLKDYFQDKTSGNIHVCALIDKKERREQEILINYSGFQVPDGFLVGYGLDFAEQFRHLQDIYHLEN
ncbi:MAG: hypoxanthine phosphoribosyltransferase [Desulfobulbaceae bacterium]|uniref:Hypoxanthine phosphoribosyltransferase n=1 Tax=Candidatus Desulfobia pelagia TaxID=2841692 RepID=A0A8J6TGI9_9BACT|nr:hypoxanthine phosphoribosyltransferase [Candidatus Desulfobia pelagia]